MTAPAGTGGPPATQAEKLTIYAAGLAQGIASVTCHAGSPASGSTSRGWLPAWRPWSC
jgi:hypothetical protein